LFRNVKWRFETTVLSLLIYFRVLLASPNYDDPFAPKVAQEFRENPEATNAKSRGLPKRETIPKSN
jgi:ubiquitin-protein ligase